MKKIVKVEENYELVVYFDFANDFPELGCEWIDDSGFTDNTSECHYEDNIWGLIKTEQHHECTESDYEYIKSLIKAWVL